MTALEDLLGSLEGARDALGPNSLGGKLNPKDARSAQTAHDEIKRVSQVIALDVRPISAEEEYIHDLNSLCGVPLSEAASDLRAQIITDAEVTSLYYQTEFRHIVSFANAALNAWKKRTTHNPQEIDRELARYNLGADSSISKRLADAKKSVAEERDFNALIKNLKRGATPDIDAISYMLMVHSQLGAQRPDWSPVGPQYFPDGKGWQLSDVGHLRNIKSTRGLAGMIGGAVARAVVGFFVPGLHILFVNPVDYIPTGYLSVKEKQETGMEGLRVRASMGKGENTPIAVDCVYAGRLLTHPKLREKALQNTLTRINDAQQKGQFFVQCFVADLRDDANGKFAKFVTGFSSPNHSMFVYDYANSQLLYNQQDWKTGQFAGWFRAGGQVPRFNGLLVPDGTEGDTPYVKLGSLQKLFPGVADKTLVSLVKQVRPGAELHGQEIYLFDGR